MFDRIETAVTAEIKKLALDVIPNIITISIESEIIDDKYNVYYNKNINKGNRCCVFLGTDITTGKDIAVKIISKDRKYGNDEVKYISVVKHKYIVTVYDIYQDDYYYYIFMEYASRGDLCDEYSNLSERQIRRIIAQVAEALEYLHSNNIVHRDIKPENILLTSNLDVKLTDFEYAGIIDSSGELITDKYCGTFGYIAPEAIKKMQDDKHKVTPKADIWSLGAMFYVTLFKRLLIDTDDPIKYYIRMERFNPYNIRSRTCSPDTISLLRKMLDKNPETRMSASDVVSHLSECK